MLSGPYLDRALDLLLQPAPLYSLTHARQLVEAADWLSGDHRPEGIYAMVGPADLGEGPEISLADLGRIAGRRAGLDADPSGGGAGRRPSASSAKRMSGWWRSVSAASAISSSPAPAA